MSGSLKYSSLYNKDKLGTASKTKIMKGTLVQTSSRTECSLKLRLTGPLSSTIKIKNATTKKSTPKVIAKT